MAAAATLLVKIATDLTDFTRNLDKSERMLGKAADRMQRAGEKLSIGFTAPFIAASAAMAKLAADDTASLAKLERTFGSASQEMKAFADEVRKTSDLTTGDLHEMMSMTQSFVTQLGIAPAKAKEMTKTVTQLSTDMAQFAHVEQQIAQEALEKALAGKTRSLVQFGIVITDADVKARAYQLGLAGVGKELTNAQKAQASMSLIMERSTRIQGEAARTMTNDARAWNLFKKELEETAGELGQTTLQVFGPFLRGATEMVARVRELSPAMRTTVFGLGATVAAIGPLLVALAALTRAVITLKTVTLTGWGALGVALAGLVAIGAHLYMTGKQASDSAKQINDFKASLVGLDKAQLKGKSLTLQGEYNQLRQQRASIVDKFAGAKANYSTRQQATVFEADQLRPVEARLKAIALQMSEVGKAFVMLDTPMPGAGGDGGFAGLVKPYEEMEQRVKNLTQSWGQAKELQLSLPGLNEQIVTSLEQVNAELAKQKNLWGDNAIALRSMKQDLMGTDIGAIFGRNVRTAGKLLDTRNGVGPLSMPSTAQVNASITNPVPKLGEVKQVLTVGFAELPAAIGSQVGMAVGQLMMKSGMGGVGGALGGAVGGGVGNYLAGKAANKIGGMLGSVVGSIIPGLGTVAGGLLGSVAGKALGGIGKLFGFGRHKKKTDESADALKRLADEANKARESISNLPSIVKLSLERYFAAESETRSDGYDPYAGPRKPTSGGSGAVGSPTGGGVNINGPIYVTANDPAAFLAQLEDTAIVKRSRGGSSGFAVATGAGR